VQHIVTLSREKQEIFLLDLYPNPVSDILTIKINTSAIRDLEISIYDVAGREVVRMPQSLSAGINKVEYDTTELPNGKYLIKLLGPNTNEVIHFVKF